MTIRRLLIAIIFLLTSTSSYITNNDASSCSLDGPSAIEYGNQHRSTIFEDYFGNRNQPGLYGLFIDYSYELANIMENTVYRIETAKSNELLSVIFQELIVYLKLLFYFILMLSAALWIGFVLGVFLGYALNKPQ